MLLPIVLMLVRAAGGGSGPGDGQEGERRIEGSNGKVYVPDQARLDQMNLYTEAAVRNDVARMLGTYLGCEACQAVAFQLLMEFNLAERYSKNKMGELPEHIVDMVATEEGACSPEHFEEHHLRAINGTRFLAGMGMPLGEESTDGEKIPGNVTVPLAILCVDIVRKVGIQTIYEAYAAQTLERTVCFEGTTSCKPPARLETNAKKKRGKKSKHAKKRRLAEDADSGGATTSAGGAEAGEAQTASDRYASTRPEYANNLITIRTDLQ